MLDAFLAIGVVALAGLLMGLALRKFAE